MVGLGESMRKLKQKTIVLSIITPTAALLTAAILLAHKTYASEYENQLSYAWVVDASVDRAVKVTTLEKFFKKYNSPLINHAETFVLVAERYNMDYKLLPSIACMESTCAKFLINGSYNPFGWGIYGSNVVRFKNYDEAIETVGKGIYTGYVLKGADTPEKIAPIYTPPNHRNWLSGVRYFSNEIDKIYNEDL